MTGALSLVVAAYLCGSIPSSWLAGRAAGVDLTRRGSGNLGGTNVFRVLGWRYALPVVVTDVAKGFVPAYFFTSWDGTSLPELALVYGLAAIVGHVWSAFLRFRGGKGVATAGGVLLALIPMAVAVGAMIWGGLVLLTRIVSVASLSAATALPLAAWLLDAQAEKVLFALVLAAFVWWTHRENVGRLVRGEELQFGGEEPEARRARGGEGGRP